MGEVLDSSRILVPKSADDTSCTEKLESLRISFDKFVEDESRSRLGELPMLSGE
jgi:hypothetical protein